MSFLFLQFFIRYTLENKFNSIVSNINKIFFLTSIYYIKVGGEEIGYFLYFPLCGLRLIVPGKLFNLNECAGKEETKKT